MPFIPYSNNSGLDIFLFDDNSWIFREDLTDDYFVGKSDDYQVLTEGSLSWGKFIFLSDELDIDNRTQLISQKPLLKYRLIFSVIFDIFCGFISSIRFTSSLRSIRSKLLDEDY
jgi:hypothetical protein